MSRPTPETNSIIRNAQTADHPPTRLAATLTVKCERLERERDEAREDLEHWKIEYEIVVSRLCGTKHERDNGIIAEHEIIPVLMKERDEARDTAQKSKAYKRVLKETNARLKRERDEARENLEEEMKFHHRTHSELVAANCKILDLENIR